MLRRLFAALLIVGSCTLAAAADSDEPIYELRIYTCEANKLPALEERFQNHTLKLFEKHGMTNLGYWNPSDGPTSETTLIYVLEHASREAAQKSWEAFRADPEWKKVAAQSQAIHGKILVTSPESVYMQKTDYSPAASLPTPGKAYELRTYTAPEGKLDALNARFRDHTDQLFNKHGIKAWGYWIPVDAPKSGNTLLYILEYDSVESAKKSWTDFRADPAWLKALEESQKNGSLTASRPESVPLKLTSWSPVAGK